MKRIKIIFIDGRTVITEIAHDPTIFIHHWATIGVLSFNDNTLFLPWHTVGSIEVLPDEGLDPRTVTPSGGIYTGETQRLYS